MYSLDILPSHYVSRVFKAPIPGLKHDISKELGVLLTSTKRTFQNVIMNIRKYYIPLPSVERALQELYTVEPLLLQFGRGCLHLLRI